MSNVSKDYPMQHFAASALAATINYPLWRASAIGQSGFAVHQYASLHPSIRPYVYAFAPPYKGMLATVTGMTWARAAIFWGSDYGKHVLEQWGCDRAVSTVVPPFVVSAVVQVVNMPLVRATVTMQNPTSQYPTVLSSMRHIYSTHGVAGLWHGTSAGILKTVPKYITAIVVKDFMEEWLAPADPTSPTYHSDYLWRSALKSSAAGVAGAVLTNPLDVIRNEMFKTNHGLRETVRQLQRELGMDFLWRGMGKNMIAVAVPVASTIFFTDAFIQFAQERA
jgi:hypothetical protein